MSKINDALKEMQSKVAVPADGPAQCPADFPSRSTNGSTLLLTALIVVALGLSGIMTWQWYRSGNAELKVRARTYNTDVNPVSRPQTSQPTVAISKPVETKSAVPVASVPAPAVAETKPSAQSPAPVAVAAVEPPKPVTYKLQGIVYVPNRCSAVINGKTVVPGDRVSGARVLSIDKDSVTIVTATGQRQILELP